MAHCCEYFVSEMYSFNEDQKHPQCLFMRMSNIFVKLFHTVQLTEYWMQRDLFFLDFKYMCKWHIGLVQTLQHSKSHYNNKRSVLEASKSNTHLFFMQTQTEIVKLHFWTDDFFFSKSSGRAFILQKFVCINLKALESDWLEIWARSPNKCKVFFIY